MQDILLIVQLLLASALIGVVLLQRSESDGFGMGSGGGSNFLSGRASANLMTRTTAILAALFIINSLALSIVASRSGHESIVDAVVRQEQPNASAPAPTTPPAAAAKPAAPVVPKVPVAKVAPTSDAAPAKTEAPAGDDEKTAKPVETETPAGNKQQ